MRITIIALGTRGDVQPLVALGVGLRRAGHAVRLATHTRFHRLVVGHGLEAAEIHDWGPGDAGEKRRPLAGVLRALSSSALHLTREALSRSRARTLPVPTPLLRRFMEDSWLACRDAELVVSYLHYVWVPSMVERLGVPCCMVHLSPLTPTREFPNLALCNRPRLGGSFNRTSYRLAQAVFLRFGVRLTNPFRRETLGLPALAGPGPLAAFYRSVRVLYGFSPSVLPRPRDWPPWHHVTGYWFLDDSSDWEPPDDLLRFLEAGGPPLCIGIGQIADKNPRLTVGRVLEALRRTDERAVLVMRGVANRGSSGETRLPSNVIAIGSAPFEWLLPRTSALVCHGGAGSMAAALRAGIPAISVPYGGDQPFWGYRVFRAGAAVRPLRGSRLTAERLADAIDAALHRDGLRSRAAFLGERVRRENGVEQAVRILETYASGRGAMGEPAGLTVGGPGTR